MFVYPLIMKQELTSQLNAPVVFSHNDLLSGNIMVNEEEGIHLRKLYVNSLLSVFAASDIPFPL